ncbi:MAG: ribulose-phosphate 3-epimerase [Bacillota bacterium]
MRIQIAPSILNADFLNLQHSLNRLSAADWIHLDIMDGHFVPNISFGVPVVQAVCAGTKLPVEAHLMVNEPDKFVEWFLPLGVKRIIVHAESTPHLHRLLSRVREAGLEAGVALNPGTAVENILPCLSITDLVLFMTVNPGFGGQAFIPEMPGKLKYFREKIQKRGSNLWIEVDGGINQDTGLAMVKAGANILVMGTYLLMQADPGKYIGGIKKVFSDSIANNQMYS